MTELPSALYSSAEKALEELQESEEPEENEDGQDAWPHNLAISRQPASPPSIGIELADRLALTPADSALARAIEDSELSVETRHATWRGQACLLFEKPELEDLLRDAVLGRHVAEELAARLAREDEDIVWVKLRGRWSLALRPVAAADTERYDSEGMPFEAFSVGGEEYILCLCTAKQIYVERGGTEAEFGKKLADAILDAGLRAIEEENKNAEAEEVADQLGVQQRATKTTDADPFEAFLRIGQEEE